MLFRPSDFENLHYCEEVALHLNKIYELFKENFHSADDSDETYKRIEKVFFGLYDLILYLDKYYYKNESESFGELDDFKTKLLESINKFYTNKPFLMLIGFLRDTRDFIFNFDDVNSYNNHKNNVELLASQIDEILSKIDKDHLFIESSSLEKRKSLFEESRKRAENLAKELRSNNVNNSDEVSTPNLIAMINELRGKYDDVLKKYSDRFLKESEQNISDFKSLLKESHNEFKSKSENTLEKFSDEINISQLNFKKDVQDEILNFQNKLKDVDADFKSSVKDFEVLKKFINAKGEQEITDHYRKKASIERITYWLMTFITFGIIIFSVCMAINGLDEYKEKANISVETLLEKYKDQPVEKIEKIYGAVQSSALTYLVLRLIFSVLLFSSIIYTSRVAYRAYIHMRHSENMMLKLATLRPFINQLDESERNQIHKDLVPDYFGKDAGLVDGASEKFKDLPANVSAVAMKAIEQIGGSTGTSNSKSPDPKDAKTAGE